MGDALSAFSTQQDASIAATREAEDSPRPLNGCRPIPCAPLPQSTCDSLPRVRGKGRSMKVIQHTSSNDVTPQGTQECQPAPCTRTVYAGCETLTTYWETTPAERDAIARGALVRIEVMGGSMPPITVGLDTRSAPS
jgi:hypothetical protein